MSIQAVAQAFEAASATVMCNVTANAQAAATSEGAHGRGLQRIVAGSGEKPSSSAMVEGRLSAVREAQAWATLGCATCHASTSAGLATQRMLRLRPRPAIQRS